MQETDTIYESRHGWSARNAAVLAIAVLMTAGTFLIDPSQTTVWLQILTLLLFGGGGTVIAYNAISKKVALRVDATGVLLGGAPLRYRATTVLVPWSEIAGVELWIQYSAKKLPYVGLHRHPDLPPLPGGRSRIGAAAVGKPAALVAASRAVNGWRLNTPALLAAIHHHAPTTDISIDLNFPTKI
ncbi:hypothetical protein ACIA8O_36740 [Kitasatospora sp. NPDC051853]|uniref:hypothetical protein n=1 Tax=Kitasatospora sp. NPDC051853 TaxID=3364058 RepID=UPI003789E304